MAKIMAGTELPQGVYKFKKGDYFKRATSNTLWRALADETKKGWVACYAPEISVAGSAKHRFNTNNDALTLVKTEEAAAEEDLTEEQEEYLQKVRSAVKELRIYGKAAIEDLQDAMKGTEPDAEQWPGAPAHDAFGRAARAGAQLEGLIAIRRSIFPGSTVSEAFKRALAGLK